MTDTPLVCVQSIVPVPHINGWFEWRFDDQPEKPFIYCGRCTMAVLKMDVQLPCPVLFTIRKISAETRPK